ncbi:hypothetical protein [Roseovarius azorensis]|nr:hypothetical protein [Roseovarius azorensis]
MKAIAEYFRDLAADDRYFGAEPPTPDADMLARIAEREISRRVQAHEEHGRIVLRAETTQALMNAAQAATETRQAEQSPEAGPDEPDETEREAAAEAAAAPAKPAESPAEPELHETAAEAENEPVETASDEGESDAESEMEGTPEPIAVVAEDEAPEPITEDEADTAEADAQDAAEDHPDLVDDSDSIAAKLSLIRSVAPESAQDETEEYSEDEHAQDFLDSAADDLDAALAADDLAERFRADADLEDEAQEADISEDYTSAAAAPPERDDFEDSLAELLADAMPDTGADEAMTAVEENEFEARLASELFDEDETETTNALRNLFSTGQAGLEPEDEDALQRELAEIEADLKSELDDLSEDDADFEEETDADELVKDIDNTEAAEAEISSPDRQKFGQSEESGDLMRFFDEADTQLEAPASSLRRNAIQHLRAAVAATRAEHKAGSELRRDVDDKPYRSDLANVVRPRRPQVSSDGERSMRPEEARPAPLKLVAEQRIDTPREPIRPRRVAGSGMRGDVESVQIDSGFSAFAEEVGAARLPDLLEAAAAYLADVEGRPQFSRPMLMGKLREVEAESYSREDGLRSFGQLLREGKLQKLSGGRFSVTELTEFRGQGKRQAG